MDAGHLAMLIDNHRPAYEEAHRLVAAKLSEMQALPGMARDSERPDLETARAIGEVIEGMVKDFACREYRLDLDRGTENLTAYIFGDTLGHIDWPEVGDHYYTTARERYEYEAGLR